MRIKQRLFKIRTFILWSILAFPFLTSQARALPTGLEIEVVDSSTTQGAFPYFQAVAINTQGNICYRGASETSAAILRSDGILKSVVASTLDGSGQFEDFPSGICAINDLGDVAFDACRNCKQNPPGQPPTSGSPRVVEYSIYKRLFSLGESAPLQTIATSGGSNLDFSIASLPFITSDGAVYFSGTLKNGLRGIWRRLSLNLGGALELLVDDSGPFYELGGVAANTFGQYTFGATQDQAELNRTIFGPNGMPLIGTGDGFSKLSLPVINAAGDVAVLASKAQPQAGSTVPTNGVFLNGEPFILNTGNFQMVEISSFRSVAINDNRQMVFAAVKDDGSSAVFLVTNGGLVTLIQEGDLIPGFSSPVFRASVGRQAINNRGDIGLALALLDGTEVVLKLGTSGISLPGDECPADNSKFTPGICGCGQPDADSNRDGVLECRVTDTTYQLTTQLVTSLQKIKRLSPRAKKSAIRHQAQIARESRSLADKLFTLVRSSSGSLSIQSSARDGVRRATNIRRLTRLAIKTSDRNYSKNRSAAIKQARQFLNLLNVKS